MKNIVITDLHHEVLEAWEACRKKCGAAPQVLSLDFHTDTLDCRRRGIPLPVNAAAAVKALHHDEHFDWALRTGIISKAVIIALSPCTIAPGHPQLSVRRHPELPDVQTLLNFPDEARNILQKILTDKFLAPLLDDDFPQKPFILDIDCDCILCEKALEIPPDSRLCQLADQAELITLSKENDWVKILKLPGETITGTSIARRFSEIFNCTPLR